MNRILQPLSIVFLSVVLLTLIIPMVSYANDDLNHDSPHGWHWYNQETNSEDNIEYTDPLDQMTSENKAILRSLYVARKKPTKANVKKYIAMQKQVVKESKAFANVWKAVLLDNPELDYSIEHPTNNFAKIIESDQETKKQEKAIRILAAKSGLFFFYRSSCPYCKAFAPTVKQFAETYGIKVIPITTDGIALPEFPNSYVNEGQAQKFNVTVEPALFAVNPYTHKAFPITYGLISLADLKKRILDIATQFDGDAK